MNVPLEDLNAWARAVLTLRALANEADAALCGKDMNAARNALLEADDAARVLGLRLERAGADRPAPLPARNDTPLHLLDTPTNRVYAERLREAWEAGLAVDRERYGADIGTNGCAQMVEMLLWDVEAEINGPPEERQ